MPPPTHRGFGRTLPPEILRRAALIKPNATEARVLTGIEVRDLNSARAAAARLLDSGVGVVALEAGDAGNLFASREEEVIVPLLDVGSVDRTGAGNAMVGALAMGPSSSRARCARRRTLPPPPPR